MRGRITQLLIASSISTLAVGAAALADLPPGIGAQIDDAVTRVLDETRVPSASIAVVHEGTIVLTRAYGVARVDPATPALPTMRYPIGSISKQFTAAALAMLAAEGKLSLDDTLASWFPELTRAGEISLRQLLSHTSGIRDYWPQDYLPPAMLEPIDPRALIDSWARRPLDFEPGTRYQYSNTGYVIAGLIVEKISGQPLTDFLRQRIFEPLGMKTVIDIDREELTADDAEGYRRYALGPLHVAPDEGKGWLFAAGPLAMTAEDLARWNVAMIEGGVPGAGVFRELTREVMLANGVGTGYGLGVSLALDRGRPVVGHGGEVSGFTAANRVYPEERAAIVVLVNQDAVDAPAAIAKAIAELLFVHASPGDAAMLERVKGILEGLRKGKIDRSLFTANANAYFTAEALEDMRTSLRRCGSLKKVELRHQGVRGGLTTRVYRAAFRRKTLVVVTRATMDHKLEQLTISAD